MYTGREIVEILTGLHVTHVVWIPDSTLGQWEAALRACESLKLITVCREGEAWHVAAGLWLGGANPLVMIQCTGLFESGDALRNVVHDLAIPLPVIVGYRSYLDESTLPGDTARIYTEPILQAWRLAYLLIDEPAKKPKLREHLLACRTAGRAGVVLIAEGRA